jgi:plasmid stabilization system protein ParE
MAYEIIWLPKAEERFDEIIDYLQQNWNDKVITAFIHKTNKSLSQIKRRPEIFRRSQKMDIYEVLITKHNLLLYRINGNRIELLTFFDTRQNPNKKFKF